MRGDIGGLPTPDRSHHPKVSPLQRLRRILAIELALAALCIVTALALVLFVTSFLRSELDRSVRASRTALAAAQGGALLVELLNILDHAQHVYQESEAFLSLDADSRQRVMAELANEDPVADSSRLSVDPPAAELPLSLEQAGRLQSAFDQLLALGSRPDAQPGPSQEEQLILWRVGQRVAMVGQALEQYLREPNVGNFLVLRGRLLVLRTEGSQAVSDLAQLAERRFTGLDGAMGLARLGLLVGTAFLGGSGLAVVLFMGKRLEAALATAEREREGLARRNEQLAALYRVYAEITDPLSVAAVVDATVREVLSLMQADVVVLRLVRGEELVVAGALTSDDVDLKNLPPQPLSEGIVGRAAKRGRAERVDRGAQELLGPSLNPERRVESGVVSPLMSGARLVGTLSCWSQQPRAFTAEDEQVLELMSSLVAAAVLAAESTEQSERRAHADALTGLANRLRLEEDLAGPLRQLASDGTRRAGVVMVDIDHFKRFNDRFGHRLGDAALRQVAAAVRSAIRATDRAYRYGGEEFLLVFEDADRRRAVALAERVRRAVEATAVQDEHGAAVAVLTVSLGVALLPDHGCDMEALIGLADQALYRAKQRGRNRTVVWQPERTRQQAA